MVHLKNIFRASIGSLIKKLFIYKDQLVKNTRDTILKDKFRGYYRPTEDEFTQLWENCLFIFDANVILNIYRYSIKTRNELIVILDKISDNLWIPHQAALEYQKRRLTVIGDQESTYENIKKILSDIRNKLNDQLNSFKLHPIINTNNIFNKIDSVLKEIGKELDILEQGHPNLIDSDNLRDKLTELFEGKVGSPCSPDNLDKISKKGNTRYHRQIPPGFKDKNKKENEYGDLILWFQIIEHAKSTKKPIIFITDDRKEDWWFKIDGKIIAPHPELINEIFSKTGVNFYMYQTGQFMKYASEYLNIPLPLEAIEEVQKIRKFDETYEEEMIREEEEYFKDHPEEAKLHELDYALVKAEDELDMLRNMDVSDWEIQDKIEEIQRLAHEFDKQNKIVEKK